MKEIERTQRKHHLYKKEAFHFKFEEIFIIGKQRPDEIKFGLKDPKRRNQKYKEKKKEAKLLSRFSLRVMQDSSTSSTIAAVS